MQREVWGPAQSDTVALLKYFEANRSKYKWGKSADAVIFYASDAATAQTFIRQLKKNPASWHELTGNFSEKITADSSRFDLTQLPNPAHQVLKAGVITSPMTNKADNSVSFSYLLRTYDQPTLRSFSEAKGLVINDYQNSLEKQWITELKKKYPVRVNEGAWKKLISTY
jgi:peptidyl-prolyl cis-trans isomerase SurA